MKPPIFIIGSERSGSNLLRLILNSHSNIIVPHPPHIFKYFKPLEKYYGNLTRQIPMKRLIKDIIYLIDTHIYPWEIKINPELLYKQSYPRNLAGVFFGIYDQYLLFSKKKRWACKSTFMIHYANIVLDHYPLAKFIWLVRDPRDVAASSRLSIFNPFHPYLTALLWRNQQLEGFDLIKSISEDNIEIFKYEDLIEEPRKIISKICDFINEKFEPQMLEFYKTHAAQKSSFLSTSWQNTTSPIISNNKNKYKKLLTKNEIYIVERITYDLMYELGYKPKNVSFRKKSILFFIKKIYYKILDKIWFIKVEFFSLLKDNNYFLRLRRAIFIKRLSLSLPLIYYLKMAIKK